jgi:hypothetical protein
MVNSAVSMTNNGTMVIDAYDTVNTFGSNFTGSAPWSNATNRLEVVSRISQSLDDAINNNRLPYATEARGGTAPSWFGGEKYVLRGKKPLAEVLVALDSVSTVTTSVTSAPPIAFKLGDRGEVEWRRIDMEDLLQWLARELGEENIQVYLEDTYLYSTDLRPYEVAARLMNLAAILKDANSMKLSALDKVISPVLTVKVRFSVSAIILVLWKVIVPTPAPVWTSTGPSSVAALVAVVGEFVKEPPPSEEQIALIKSALLQHRGDGTHYDRAGEWLDALATYVSTLNTGLGWFSERSIGFVMSRYGSELDMTSAMFVEMYLRDHLAANNKQYSKQSI